MEDQVDVAKQFAQRITDTDFYTRRGKAAEGLPFAPFELFVEPFLTEQFITPATVIRVVEEYNAGHEDQLHFNYGLLQTGHRTVGLNNGEYDGILGKDRPMSEMVVNWDEDFLEQAGEFLTPAQIGYLRRKLPPIDVEIATALARVSDESGEEEQSAIAFNCGGNIYVKMRQPRQLWKLATEAWLDSGYGPGAGGSRFMNGTTRALVNLEQRIAKRTGYEYGLVTNTGFNANEVAITTLMRGDIDVREYLRKNFRKHVAIRAREAVHASVNVPVEELEQQGYLPSRHEQKVDEFKPYFDPANPESLREVFEDLQGADYAEKVVFVNAVGSVDGMTYDLKAIQKICNEYDGLLFVDDAHGGFIIGETSRGICEYLGMDEAPDFYFTTLSKSAESEGGVLLTNHAGFVDSWKKQPRIIYTAAPSPLKLEYVHAKLDYIDSYFTGEDGAGLGEAVRRKNNQLYAALTKGGVAARVEVSETNPDTSILALEVDGDNFMAYAAWSVLLHDFGVYTNLFPLEASGKNKPLLRMSTTSNFSSRVINIIAARIIQWNQMAKGQEALNQVQMAEALGIPEYEVEPMMMALSTKENN